MQAAKEQIDLFLKKCDEVTASGFILADTKIGELLKAIAASDLLYAFFREITRGFDYPAACRRCMAAAEGGRKKLLFPEDPVEKLAFIFCLLVDFDNKTLDLSAFLQEYFYGDGSIYESFYAFCNQVIKPFRGAIKAMFKDGVPHLSRPAAESVTLAGAVAAERDEVVLSSLPDPRKVDALLLLNALEDCAGGREPARLAGALCGYLYFAAACGRRGKHVAAMRAAFDSIKETL